MTRKQLKQIIRTCITEVVDEQPPQEGSPTEVTFSITGPGGEGSFSMPVEVAQNLQSALMSVIGGGEEPEMSPEAPEVPSEEPEGEVGPETNDND